MRKEEIKKYILSKFNNSDNSISYYLDKKININDPNGIAVKTLFHFNDKYNNIQKMYSDNDEKNTELTWVGDIIFDSDNLDECYKELELLVNVNKYQL